MFFLLISIVFCQMCSFRVHCCDAVAYHHSVLCLVWWRKSGSFLCFAIICRICVKVIVCRTLYKPPPNWQSFVLNQEYDGMILGNLRQRTWTHDLMVNAVHSWRELAPLQTRATLGGVSYTPLRHFNVGTLHLTQSLTKKTTKTKNPMALACREC